MRCSPSNPCATFSSGPQREDFPHGSASRCEGLRILHPEIARTPDIEALIALGAPIAFAISGGKDGEAATLACFAYLNAVGHRGPRVLIHSDLGSVEWTDSLPSCRRLADHLNVDLIVVGRKAGGLVQRWESRWASSIARYAALETVSAVLPWSTPSMRFCTSELKTKVIDAELRRRYRGQVVINVTGVRREESARRAKGTIATRAKDGRSWTWRPISDWTTAQVFERIEASGLAVHEAYTRYGLTRVSCLFCIMSSLKDLRAAVGATESHALYRQLVDLEIRSTFGFQGARWLADIAPQLLDQSTRNKVDCAKQRAAARIALEKRLTKEMLYVDGWPTRMLTDEEAGTLADVRTQISTLLDIQAHYLDAPSIHRRYADLMERNEVRRGKRAA